MKLILIGEEHLSCHGPSFLLYVLQIIREKNLTCRIALEIPYEERIEILYPINADKELGRKELIESSLKLYPFFAADTANKENQELRDQIIASQISEQYSLYKPDVIVMLVGALHLPNLLDAIKNFNGDNGDIDILFFAPRIGMINFFPHLLTHMINNNGYFYALNKDNWEKAKERVSQFINTQPEIVASFNQILLNESTVERSSVI